MNSEKPALLDSSKASVAYVRATLWKETFLALLASARADGEQSVMESVELANHAVGMFDQTIPLVYVARVPRDISMTQEERDYMKSTLENRIESGARVIVLGHGIELKALEDE